MLSSLLALTISQDTWNMILNGVGVLILALLGKLGVRVAESQTTRVVDRLDAIDHRLDDHDRQLSKVANGVSHVSDDVRHVSDDVAEVKSVVVSDGGSGS